MGLGYNKDSEDGRCRMEAREGGCVHATWSFVGMVRTLQFLYYTTVQIGTTEDGVVNTSCTHYPGLIVKYYY